MSAMRWSRRLAAGHDAAWIMVPDHSAQLDRAWIAHFPFSSVTI
jgi:hypothetical protein